MKPSVQERARAIATFRYVQVRLMEIAAAWTPATPEMEVKVMLGRHIWDFAQHADMLGGRTFELRQPAHYTLTPAKDYLDVLHEVASQTSTPSRLAALYDGLLPALEARYRAYMASSDEILDGPSLVIMERILGDIRRMIADASAVRTRMKIAAVPADAIQAHERRVSSIVAEAR